MRRAYLTIASVVALLLLTCTPAVAQQGRQDQSRPPSPPSAKDSQSTSHQVERFINDFDDNGDQALEKQELPPRMRGEFASLDRNGDDKLSRSELERHGRQASRSIPIVPIEFVYIWVNDADQGHLSLHELQRAYDTLQKIDKDGNGELARSELQACRKANIAKWAKMVTKRLDENDDQKLSEQEVRGSFLAGRFDEVDSNGDGAIERQELQQCATRQQSGSTEASDRRTAHREPDDDRQDRGEYEQE